MTSTLTRIDATFNAPDSDVTCGVTIFATTDQYRREKVAQFEAYGWDVLQSSIDLAPLTRHERGGLVGPIWPLLPLDEILALVRVPPGFTRNDFVFEPKEEP